ncbi:MAG: fluoride efflux transporter CrcB [Bacillus sp. (in: firmicutes)]
MDIEVLDLIYLFVGLGGMAGSLLRYLISVIVVHLWGGDFPIGTLIINLSGAFLLGWVTSHLVIPRKLNPTLITALTTGVIGSYTTFSTFCYETVHLYERGEYLFVFLYSFVSFYGGLFLVKAGMDLSEKGSKSRRII